MAAEQKSDDLRAIKAVIDRQFRNLEWSSGQDGDWDTFAKDFHADATLYPAARLARQSTVDDFVERMKGLLQTSLLLFKERTLGAETHVFGTVAVALGACEITENTGKVTRDIEATLLIKEETGWKIVSQAWDMENDGKSIPDYLLSGRR